MVRQTTLEVPFTETPRTHIQSLCVAAISLIAWACLLRPALAQHTDPLGNPVFDKSGKELYTLQARFGVLGGDSLLRRDSEFRSKTSNRNFFTFNIPGENVLHQLTVGNFPTKFSSFHAQQGTL